MAACLRKLYQTTTRAQALYSHILPWRARLRKIKELLLEAHDVCVCVCQGRKDPERFVKTLNPTHTTFVVQKIFRKEISTQRLPARTSNPAGLFEVGLIGPRFFPKSKWLREKPVLLLHMGLYDKHTTHFRSVMEISKLISATLAQVICQRISYYPQVSKEKPRFVAAENIKFSMLRQGFSIESHSYVLAIL